MFSLLGPGCSRKLSPLLDEFLDPIFDYPRRQLVNLRFYDLPLVVGKERIYRCEMVFKCVAFFLEEFSKLLGANYVDLHKLLDGGEQLNADRSTGLAKEGPREFVN